MKESLQNEGIATEVKGYPGYVGMSDKGKVLQGLRRYSKKQPSHVSLYLAFQLQYSPVQTATEHS
jgi:hypothetical protein